MHYSRYMINDFNYHFKASGKIKNGARWQRDLISAALWSGCHATRFPSGLWVSSTEPRRPTRPLFPLASIFIRHWCSTNGFWVDAVNTTIWQGFMKSDRNIIKYALNLTTGIVECLTMFVVAYHVWRGRVCCCYGMLGRCIIQKKESKYQSSFAVLYGAHLQKRSIKPGSQSYHSISLEVVFWISNSVSLRCFPLFSVNTQLNL